MTSHNIWHWNVQTFLDFSSRELLITHDTKGRNELNIERHIEGHIEVPTTQLAVSA